MLVTNFLMDIKPLQTVSKITYFRIKMMFGSSLPPVVCRRARVLLCMFAYSDVQHFVLSNVFTFCVPCCVVLYDFLIKNYVLYVFTFSCLQGDHFLFTLFVFVYVQCCPTDMLLCFLFGLFSSCVLCSQHCQFLDHPFGFL